MRFLRIAGGAIAVYVTGLALTLGLTLGYQAAHAKWVRPLLVTPVKIELPEFPLTCL